MALSCAVGHWYLWINVVTNPSDGRDRLEAASSKEVSIRFGPENWTVVPGGSAVVGWVT